MKPHEIIEIIFTEVCYWYGIRDFKKLLKRGSNGKYKTNGAIFSNARRTIAALLSKYLGRQHAIEIMGSSEAAMYGNIAEHKRQMMSRHRYYTITNKVVLKITKEEYKPALSKIKTVAA